MPPYSINHTATTTVEYALQK